jgi:type I restriction enzyme R subunit
MRFTGEDAYEVQFLEWLPESWEYMHGPEIASDGSAPERESYKDVILASRVEEALARINPGLPKDAIRTLRQKLASPGETDILRANQLISTWMTEGISIKVRDANGEETTRLALIIDFENPQNNEWLAVNQFTVSHDSDSGSRRPDIVLFLNGLPIVVIELKSPDNLEENVWKAFNQIQTYKEQISRLFYYNVALIIADGSEALVGSLSADKERFSKWRSTDGLNKDPHGEFGKTQTLIEGFLNPTTILEVIQHFSIFITGKQSYKMLPAYHQFYAVEKAYQRALIASAENGDGRGGLMWHTQGSGKSYEMSCLAGMLTTSKHLKNPTVVVVTDRNNLDHQLFDIFMAAKALMRQTPEQADSREELRELIANRASGGVIFTTIQKFAPEEDEDKFPVLTDRRNVFVFTDEAHRSQYGFSARISGDKFKVGYAQHLRDALPNATFLAFTGTPVSAADRNTRQVFGDEIDIYDMLQANEDGATVPIYYESRLISLELPEDAKKELNDLAEELLEDEDEIAQSNLKQRWAAIEQIVRVRHLELRKLLKI